MTYLIGSTPLLNAALADLLICAMHLRPLGELVQHAGALLRYTTATSRMSFAHFNPRLWAFDEISTNLQFSRPARPLARAMQDAPAWCPSFQVQLADPPGGYTTIVGQDSSRLQQGWKGAGIFLSMPVAARSEEARAYVPLSFLRHAEG